MPAARYWRLVAFDVALGGDLRLAEVELNFGGSRVDGAATITSTAAPTSGALDDLKNGSTADDVRFAASAVARSGFEIAWDFGSDTDVDAFTLTLPGGAENVNYCELQYQAAGVWQTQLRWFGRFTTASPRVFDNGSDTSYGDVIFQLAHEPLSLERCDVSRYRRSVELSGNLTPTVGNAAAYLKWGSKSVWMNSGSMSATSTLRFAASDSLTGDFCVDAWVLAMNYGSTVRSQIISFGPTSSSWGLTTYSTGSGVWGFQVRNAAGTEVMTWASVSQLTWNFVQWVREAGVHKLLVNGTQRATLNDTSTINISEFRLGNLSGAASATIWWDGLRVTKGVVRPSTVPTGPFPEPPMSDQFVLTALPQRISEYPVGNTTLKADTRPERNDRQDGGTVALTGTVKRKDDPANVPLRRRVRLYNERDRRFIRETWSDATTGVFTFSDLKAGEVYTAFTYDHLNNYRALVLDQIAGA